MNNTINAKKNQYSEVCRTHLSEVDIAQLESRMRDVVYYLVHGDLDRGVRPLLFDRATIAKVLLSWVQRNKQLWRSLSASQREYIAERCIYIAFDIGLDGEIQIGSSKL